MIKKSKYILIIIFWILVWQAFSMLVDNQLLLASPELVAKVIIELIKDINFYNTILGSITNIIYGFILACTIGSVLAYVGYKNKLIDEILSPLIIILKSVPVVSFIILLLVWINNQYLPIVIGMIMGTPIFYTNIKYGFISLNKNLNNLSKVFRLSIKTKLRYIYIPQLLNYFKSSCILAIGLCFKSTIAAEVIGVISDSIGDNLYQAKIFLDTPTLFAWTIIIIILTFIFEKLVAILLYILDKKINEVRL